MFMILAALWLGNMVQQDEVTDAADEFNCSETFFIELI